VCNGVQALQHSPSTWPCPEAQPSAPPTPPLPAAQIERSYSEAYDLLKGCKDPDVLNTAHPKLSQEAQATAPGARRIPFSDIYATGKGRSFRAGGLLNMPTKEIPTHGAKMKNMVTCGMRCTAIGSMHVILALYGYRCAGAAGPAGDYKGAGHRDVAPAVMGSGRRCESTRAGPKTQAAATQGARHARHSLGESRRAAAAGAVCNAAPRPYVHTGLHLEGRRADAC
jgi:hypothetical protein